MDISISHGVSVFFDGRFIASITFADYMIDPRSSVIYSQS